MTEIIKNSLYRRSSTAPVFVADKKSNNRLQSFIEKNLSLNDEKFLYALESRQPLRITIPRESLREWFAPMSRNYIRDIMFACDNLMNRRIKAIKGNTFDIINVFTRCTLDEDENLHIEVSPEGVAAYNYVNDKKYLLYDATIISNFDRAETPYFYDKAIRTLAKKEWSFECTVEELKEQFQTVTFVERTTKTGTILVERKNFSDSQLKNKIIDPVLKDLQDKHSHNYIDFFLDCGDVRVESKSGRGRKKTLSYIFNIVQVLPQLEEEKGIMLQEITILLTQYIEDKTLVYRLLQPWNNKEMNISLISRLKQNLSYFENKYKKGKIDNPVGYLRIIMNPDNIYKEIKDSIISSCNVSNSKWDEVKGLVYKKSESQTCKQIENFVIHNYVEESNTLDIRMILESQTAIQFLFGNEFGPIIKDCIKEIFGNNVSVNLFVNRNGELKSYTYIE